MNFNMVFVKVLREIRALWTLTLLASFCEGFEHLRRFSERWHMFMDFSMLASWFSEGSNLLTRSGNTWSSSM